MAEMKGPVLIIWGLLLASVLALIVISSIVTAKYGFGYTNTYTLTGIGQYPAILQPLSDWIRQPYVDIQVATGGAACPENYEAMFENTWYGTVEGCQLTYDDGTVQIVTKSEWDANKDSENLPDCTAIPANDPVVQTMTLDENRTLCGKRGGDTYLSATLASDGVCPDGYTSCNINGEQTYVLCKSSDQTDDCAVSYMKWRNFQGDEQITFEQAQEQAGDFTLIEDSLLLDTTTQADTYISQYLGYIRGSYGVMDTTMTNAATVDSAAFDYPCFNQTVDVSASYVDFYPLENVTLSCPDAGYDTNDQRYQITAPGYTEQTQYMIEDQSGVDDILKSMPGYYSTYDYAGELMTNVKAYAYRNTIMWSDDCEDGTTEGAPNRQTWYDYLDSFQKGPYNQDLVVDYKTYYGSCTVMFSLVFLVTCTFFGETKSRHDSKVSLTMIGAIIILAIPMTLLGIQQANTNDGLISYTEGYAEAMDYIGWANCTYGVATYTDFSQTVLADVPTANEQIEINAYLKKMTIPTMSLTGLAMILAFLLQACHCKESDKGYGDSVVDDDQQQLNPSED